MSFPRQGDQSAAFEASLTVQGVNGDEDVLVVRSGAIVVGITEGTIGAPSISQFEQFTHLALAKVRQGSSMGVIYRLLPRGVRRAMHPGRTVQYRLTPRPIRRASCRWRTLRHPVRRRI